MEDSTSTSMEVGHNTEGVENTSKDSAEKVSAQSITSQETSNVIGNQLRSKRTTKVKLKKKRLKEVANLEKRYSYLLAIKNKMLVKQNTKPFYKKSINQSIRHNIFGFDYQLNTSGRPIHLSFDMTEDENKMLEHYKAKLSILKIENGTLHRQLKRLATENAMLLQKAPKT